MHGQYNLGAMYDYGEGVAEDDAEAARWYRKAAEQGDADATKRLEELANAGSSTNQQNAALDEKASEEFSDPAFDEGIAYLLSAANAAGSNSFYANEYSENDAYTQEDVISDLLRRKSEGPTGGNSYVVYKALMDGEIFPRCRERGRLNVACTDFDRKFSFAPNPSLAGQIKRKKGCYSARNPGC